MLRWSTALGALAAALAAIAGAAVSNFLWHSQESVDAPAQALATAFETPSGGSEAIKDRPQSRPSPVLPVGAPPSSAPRSPSVRDEGSLTIEHHRRAGTQPAHSLGAACEGGRRAPESAADAAERDWDEPHTLIE